MPDQAPRKKPDQKTYPIPAPKSHDDLSDSQRKMWDDMLRKYEPDDLMPIIESLLVAGKPITGFMSKITPEYILGEFIKIAKTDPNGHNRVIALEKIARMQGCFGNNDKQQSAEVKISFDEEQPAGWTFKNKDRASTN